MEREELFNRTINVLVKAYQQNTLAHRLCQACAVGNIVAASNPEIEKCGDLPCGDYSWSEATYHAKHREILTSSDGQTQGMIHISNTGYTVHDMILIEEAFESQDRYPLKDEDGYRGLMSVVDCLMAIHNADQKTADEAKSLFVKEIA